MTQKNTSADAQGTRTVKAVTSWLFVGLAIVVLLGPRPIQAACAAPSFDAPLSQQFAAGSGPQSVAVGDFSGDGKPDLAVANWASNNVSVLLGNGTGSFGTGRRPRP